MLTPEQKSYICRNCQKCCIVLAIPTDAKDLEFYRTRGCNVITSEGRNYIVINQRCQHLSNSGCKIYKDRPQTCRDYWGMEDPFVGRCDLRALRRSKDVTGSTA